MIRALNSGLKATLMQYLPPEIERQAELVLDFVRDVVAVFHSTQDFDESYLIIKDKDMDRLARVFIDAKASEMNRLLQNLMRMTWNNTPLASNQYKPKPLPELRRNDKCWCGSGLKYKQCCLRDANMPVPIDSTTIWSLLLPALSTEEIRDAMKQHAIPAFVLVSEAVEDFDSGNYEDARKKLEPLFEQNLKKAKEDTCFAVNLLCNTYDALSMQSKKIDFLDRIKDSGSKPLRSEAWQRLATVYIDQGDNDLAWEAFHTARHLDHSNPGVDLLEVSLLMGEGNLEKAQERAKFILRRMNKNGTYEKDDGLTQYLESIANNPQESFEELYDHAESGELDKLSDWLETVEDRPLPVYQLTEIPALKEEEESALSTNSTKRNEYIYKAPSKLAKLEEKWSEVFQGIDTFGLNTLPSEYSPWDDSQQWLDFLQKHPECFDSMDILDDITLAVKEYQPDPWVLQNVLIPLGVRAVQIYEKLPVSGAFSWLVSENRPLIRSLFNLAEAFHFAGEVIGSIEIYEIMLEANPDDNHGIRTQLINQYLFQHDYTRIEKLLNMFPKDILIDMEMGRVLYLLQIDNKKEAKKYWQEAQIHNPHIKRYMISPKVSQPQAGEFGAAVGGKEEAWEYRQAMREVWLKEKGAISWLKT